MKFRRVLAAVSLASMVCLAAAPARAQDVISKDDAALVKASFLNDLETLRTKFVGLAEAFRGDVLAWVRLEVPSTARCPAGLVDARSAPLDDRQ